jgi:hypothetical protein
MWLIIQLVSIAAMPAVYDMARNRDRSTRAWLGTALIIGPLALIALLVLGRRNSDAIPTAPWIGMKRRWDDGFDLYQNRDTGWPADTDLGHFPGPAKGRNPCHRDLRRRCLDPSFRGPLKDQTRPGRGPVLQKGPLLKF